MSVQSWALPAPEPTAGWPRPLMADEFRGWPRGTLRNPTEAGQLLGRAVGFWDVASMRDGDRWLRNQGIGGPALDALMGGSLVASSNDPVLLTYNATVGPYVYLPGASGNYLSVPDAAALDITGDIDIRVKVAMDDWTPAAETALLVKWDQAGGGPGFSYAIRLNAAGTLSFMYSAGAGAIVRTSTVATGFTDGATKWVRATFDVDNGSTQNVVTFYTSDDGSTWTQLGAAVTNAGVASIQATSTNVTIGRYTGTPDYSAAGKFYRAQVYNGIAGTLVLDVDTSVVTGAATSFTATTGQTVTINRATSGRKTVCVTQPCWLFGTDDYMEIPDNALLDFGVSDSFTVLAVVRQWATPTNYGRYISKGPTTSAGWYLAANGTAVDTFGDLFDGTDHAYPQGANFTAGALTSLGIVVDRTAQTARTITNGSLDPTVSMSAVGSLENTYAMRIGRLGGSDTGYQDFELVAVAVFRRALTAAQISAIYTYYAGRGS